MKRNVTQHKKSSQYKVCTWFCVELMQNKYTNLRKGEKLHEELFYKKELIKKTTNQSIMVTSSKVYPLDSVKYAKFLKIYKTGTESNIIKSFCTLLPEFNRLKH